jgi:hypothetical protein
LGGKVCGSEQLIPDRRSLAEILVKVTTFNRVMNSVDAIVSENAVQRAEMASTSGDVRAASTAMPARRRQQIS